MIITMNNYFRKYINVPKKIDKEIKNQSSNTMYRVKKRKKSYFFTKIFKTQIFLSKLIVIN